MKITKPTEKVFLATRDDSGKIVAVDPKELLADRAEPLLGYGDSAEEFLDYLESLDLEITRNTPEPWPDGVVLENCHVHSIEPSFLGGYSVSITWENERPLKMRYYDTGE
jgi:hypothetical protein